jgi:hypothetical protein
MRSLAPFAVTADIAVRLHMLCDIIARSAGGASGHDVLMNVEAGEPHTISH